jgi:hypothetical protein
VGRDEHVVGADRLAASLQGSPQLAVDGVNGRSGCEHLDRSSMASSPYPTEASRLSKMLECGIKDAAGGLSIFAVQNVDVEARPDDEQYGQDANHVAKVVDTA